ncbi:hypothetical protein AB4254_11140 [Vibrio breoganii]
MSLDGLYAAEVSRSFAMPSILIYPCVEPIKSLTTLTGVATNFSAGGRRS